MAIQPWVPQNVPPPSWGRAQMNALAIQSQQQENEMRPREFERQNALAGAQIDNLYADNMRAEEAARTAQRDTQRKQLGQQLLGALDRAQVDPSNDQQTLLLARQYSALTGQPLPPDEQLIPALQNPQTRAQLITGYQAQVTRELGLTPQQPKGPGTLYRVGPQGRYVTAEQAIGQTGYEKPERPPGMPTPPAGYRFTADGTSLEPIPGGPASLTGSKTTDTERTAAGYLGRMEASERLMTDAKTPGIKDFVAYNSVLSGGPGAASIANKLISPEAQKTFQAQSDWVRAKLRKESGAAIGATEMINEIRTYFPIPGDSQATIDQKRAARQEATQAMRIQSAQAAPARSGGLQVGQSASVNGVKITRKK